MNKLIKISAVLDLSGVTLTETVWSVVEKDKIYKLTRKVDGKDVGSVVKKDELLVPKKVKISTSVVEFSIATTVENSFEAKRLLINSLKKAFSDIKSEVETLELNLSKI